MTIKKRLHNDKIVLEVSLKMMLYEVVILNS